MTGHYCTKEKELGEMHEMLTRIDEAIRGNGKPGLVTQMAVWKNTVLGLAGLCIMIVTGLIALWLKP